MSQVSTSLEPSLLFPQGDVMSLPTAPSKSRFGESLVVSEMHHRWANTLAVLSGTLRTCNRGTPSTAEILRRIGNIERQVQSMASMHRRLYQPATALETVEGYCRSLCIDVVLSHGREDVTPWVDMCDISLPQEALTTLGAIVVELMTNTLKHGKAPEVGGIVWFSLTPTTGGHLELSVSDNFAPPGTIPVPPKMISALVRDLGGDVSIRLTPGYTTRIRIPH